MLFVLAPEGAEGVRSTLAAWAVAGLTQPIAWWSSAETAVDRIHGKGVDTMPAAAALQGVDARDVLVVAFLMGEQSEGDSDVDLVLASFQRMFAELRRALPPALGPRLPALILCPRTSTERFPVQLGAGAFRPVLVLAPEDRRHPVDASVLMPKAFDGHLAHALAALGGSFLTGSATPPLTALTELAEQHLGSVLVVRGFTRMLDFGYLADHVASQVLRPGSHWANPDGRHFDRKALDGPQQEFLVDGYFDFDANAEALGLTAFEPEEPEPSPKFGLLAALKAIFRYLVDSVRRKSVSWLDATVGGIFDSFASRVERLAPRSGVQVVKWRERDPSTSVATYVDETLLVHELVVPDGAVAPAWTDMWKLAIGLVDGSGVPAWVDEKQLQSGGLRQVVGDPATLVPDPEEFPPVRDPDSGERLRACDPRHWEPLTSNVAVKGWQEAPAQSLLWRIGARLAHNLRTAEEESVFPAPDEWPDAEQVAQDLETIRKRSRRRFLRAALLWTLLAFALGMVTLFSGFAVWAKVVIWFGLWILWLLSLARQWRKSDRAYSEAERAAKERLYTLLNRVLLAMYRRSDAVRLQRRYTEFLDWAEILGLFLHRPFVSRPGQRAEVKPDADPSTLPAAFELRVGLTSDETLQDISARVQSRLFEPAWLRSFADQIVRLVMHAVMRSNGDDPETSGVPVPDPFGDTANDPGSPRRELLSVVRRGEHRGITENRMTTALLDQLGRFTLTGIASDALPIGSLADREADRLVATAAWLGAPAGMDSLADSLRPTVVRIRRVGTGSSMGSGVIVGQNGLAVTNRHVVAGDGTLEIEVPATGWLPATVAAVSTKHDLAVVSFPTDVVVTPARLAQASAVQGSAVVMIGHPFALDGEPTLTWGLVSAARRTVDLGDGAEAVLQTSYPGGGGASGAPVFDVTGAVTGIHVGAADAAAEGIRAEHVSFAVPIEDVHELLHSIGADTTATPLPRIPVVGVVPEGDPPEVMDPEAFFAELLDVVEPVHFHPDLWVAGTFDAAQVGTVYASEFNTPLDALTVEAAAGPVRLFGPVRAWATRVDVSTPCLPESLNTMNTALEPPAVDEMAEMEADETIY